MADDPTHAGCVDAWLSAQTGDLSAEELLPLFGLALATLWNRTATTIGAVTLTAIADRVIYDASREYPMFSALVVRPEAGIRCEGLLAAIDKVPPARLQDGMRYVLVEFLTVLGNLTADILTPQLHAALSGVGAASRPGGAPRSTGRSRRGPASRSRKGKKS